MTQQQARLERIERIAQLMRGPVSGKVHQASTYFTSTNAAHAEAIARRDQENSRPQEVLRSWLSHPSPQPADTTRRITIRGVALT